MSFFPQMGQTRVFSNTNYFDVPYGIASVDITNGIVLITSTGGAYHGISVTATSAGANVLVYDAAATATTGRLLEIFTLAANAQTRVNLFQPVVAKKGIVCAMGGTGAKGAIYFSPKG